jgi:hypothetical protein
MNNSPSVMEAIKQLRTELMWLRRMKEAGFPVSSEERIAGQLREGLRILREYEQGRKNK